jgi:hypothetical protein
MDQPVVSLGELIGITVEIKNKMPEGLPSTMAIIGIPSGASVQPWQLKKLQEEGAFDFYELRNQQLLLYYRQMKPNEVKRIRFDLKTETKGVYEAPASCAYLYYADENKDWEQMQPIEIK